MTHNRQRESLVGVVGLGNGSDWVEVVRTELWQPDGAVGEKVRVGMAGWLVRIGERFVIDSGGRQQVSAGVESVDHCHC